MKSRLIILILGFSLGLISVSFAASIKGKVVDDFGEPLVGANVTLEGQTSYAIAGLDGSFVIANLQPGTYKVKISFVGFTSFFQEVTLEAVSSQIALDINLKPDTEQLGEFIVNGKSLPGSEREARTLERNSMNTVNVVSAKSIELSPDITVANVVQRVSGLTLERNSNGDPQYVVVRGMDKRYNYTLVNGVKIPSPDNKNRYLPLDIFPAQLLERLEVHKSLTPSMEGDAIGGATNMVMKSAPSETEIKFDLQSGYNVINLQNGFNTFDAPAINRRSPSERFGPEYRAQVDDFSQSNLLTENISPIPDFFATMSAGGRLLKDKLGIIVAASLQNSYRGTESIWYDYSIQSNTEVLLPQLDKLQERYYSTRQQRNGFHANIDYKFSDNHTIKFYNGYFMLNDHQVRELQEFRIGGATTNPAIGFSDAMQVNTRTRLTLQNIYNSTLSGEHILGSIQIDWSAVYSIAKMERPDNAQFNTVTEMRDFEVSPLRVARENPRRWENNSDEDYTIFTNVTYSPGFLNGESYFKSGLMYRAKERSSFFNEYIFNPRNLSTQGVNWNDYTDVDWRLVNPLGTLTNALNYDASENILAYFIEGNFDFGKLDVKGGVRVEHTEQGYLIRRPTENVRADTLQTYVDFLPSLHLKYGLRPDMNLKGGYFYGISRPGFFEIVPYRILDEDYNERGNPDLRRVRAHNFDTRWEYFPNVTDQILVGFFYKKIMDPIEYALLPIADANNRTRIFLTPANFGTAHNYGFELDVSKFFNKFGIRGNYTFTHSEIEAVKSRVVREKPTDPSSELITVNEIEARPLQGQARHIGNFSLLYKDMKKGTDVQLAFVYTGERLENVSPFFQNDSWALPILQIDVSIEQSLGEKSIIFFKANNIHNAPYEVVVRGLSDARYREFPHQQNMDNQTLIRRDQYFQSFRLGFRHTFK
jgi:hypothetical protein